MAESLRFCAHKYDAKIAGFVFMPTHLHLAVFVEGQRLSDLMRDFKKFFSQKLAPELGPAEQPVWRPRFDRVVILSERVLKTKIAYIHNNPVKAGLVRKPEFWP